METEKQGLNKTAILLFKKCWKCIPESQYNVYSHCPYLCNYAYIDSLCKYIKLFSYIVNQSHLTHHFRVFLKFQFQKMS